MAAITQALDSSGVDKALRVAFSKIEYDPRQSKNLLSAVFSRTSNLAFKNFYDFLGKISTTSVTDVYKALDATPGMTIPGNRRRETNIYGEVIHVPFPRAHARMKNITIGELIKLYKGAAQAAVEVANQTLMLKIISGKSHKESELTAAQRGTGDRVTATSTVTLPSKQYAVPHARAALNSTTAAPTFRFPLDVSSWFQTTADFDNVIGKSGMTGQGGMQMSIDDIQRVAIFSNDGWANFQDFMKDRLGNRDYFGKSVYINGYGEFPMFHKYVVITLPDEGFPAVPKLAVTARAGAKIVTAGPYYWDNITALSSSKLDVAGSDITAGRGVASKFLNVDEFYKGIFLPVNNIKLLEPTQLDVDWTIYRDQDESLEHKIFCKINLEGLRCHDPLYREILFSSHYASITNAQLIA